VDQYDISSIKVLLSGAAPLGAALVKQVRTVSVLKMDILTTCSRYRCRTVWIPNARPKDNTKLILYRVRALRYPGIAAKTFAVRIRTN
jgi:hypothetical protein